MAQYLVTGAAGFIGARVAEMILEDGHTVLGLDNLNDAYDVRIKNWRLKRLLDHENFSFQQVDISDKEAFESLDLDPFRRLNDPLFDGIINLAARAGVRQSVEDPWVYVNTNVTGTLNLLELCRRNEIPKFILASTSSIYGAGAPLPTPEDAPSDKPLQPYAASKKGAEALCHAYHYLNDLDVTIFRYFTVYGPAGRPDMVMFRFVQWIMEGKTLLINGDGEQSRGFTYIDDIARGTILGLRPMGFQIINLGGHETITINELVEIFEKKTALKAIVEHRPRHPADMQANWANVEKAEELLGWRPEFSLDQGIEALVAWYRDERDWAREVKTA